MSQKRSYSLRFVLGGALIGVAMGACDSRPAADLPSGSRSSGIELAIAGTGGASPPTVSTLPECSPVSERWKHPVSAAFDSTVSAEEPRSGTVREVSADQLVIRKPNGASLKFRWAGPSLVDAFKEGEVVTYEWKRFWNVVRSDTHTAAAFTQMGFVQIDRKQQIPDGPTYESQASCKAVGGTQFRLHVEWKGETSDVEVGETGTLGEWQITNAAHLEGSCSFSPANACCCDPVLLLGVFALGPSP